MSLITKAQLITDLKSLGIVEGNILNVKASLRSIGNIDGGAKSLIEALIECVGQDGTIITDSFINCYRLFSFRFWSNLVCESTPSYAGALANAMIKHESSIRSNHPIQKFCLIGKYANELAENHTPDKSAYEILEKIAEMGAMNLKIGSEEKVIGVGTTHVAIVKSKKRQLRDLLGVRYRDKNNKVKSFMINWSGACKGAINELNELYNSHPNSTISKGYVGNAPAKLTCMATTLYLEEEYLSNNPEEFLTCSDKDCVCHYTWENIGKNPLEALVSFIFKLKLKKAWKCLYIAIFYKYPF